MPYMNVLVWENEFYTKVAIPDTPFRGYGEKRNDGVVSVWRALQDLHQDKRILDNTVFYSPKIVTIPTSIVLECAQCSLLPKTDREDILESRREEWLQSELN